MQIPASKTHPAAMKKLVTALHAASDPIGTLVSYVQPGAEHSDELAARAFVALLPALDAVRLELDGEAQQRLNAKIVEISVALGRPEGKAESLDRQLVVALAAKDWTLAQIAIKERAALLAAETPWRSWECDEARVRLYLARNDLPKAAKLLVSFVKNAEKSGAWDEYVRGLELARALSDRPGGEELMAEHDESLAELAARCLERGALSAAKERLVQTALAAATSAEEIADHDKAAAVYTSVAKLSGPAAVEASKYFARRGSKEQAETILRETLSSLPRNSEGAKAIQAELLGMAAAPLAPNPTTETSGPRAARKKITQSLTKIVDAADVLRDLVAALNDAMAKDEWDRVGALLAENVELALQLAKKTHVQGRDEVIDALRVVPFGGQLVAAPARVSSKKLETERATLSLAQKSWVERGEIQIEIEGSLVRVIELEITGEG